MPWFVCCSRLLRARRTIGGDAVDGLSSAVARALDEVAQILGLDADLGTLETGKEATLIVTDGDPLDIRSHVLRAFIAGREIELTSRHTRLYEKYKQRPLPSGDG